MKISNNKATVLICSCDNYSDIWVPFFTLFQKNWPDCPFRIILNTESKTYPEKWVASLQLYEGVNKKISYGRRMIDHLNHIETEYVILLLDDFFLRGPVSTKRILQLLEQMDFDKSIASINFDISYDIADDLTSLQGYRLKPNYSDYKLDLQAGIWRKDVLLKYWLPYMSPWDFEYYGSILTINDGYKYYQRDYHTPPIFYYYDQQNFFEFGLRGGKWYKNSVESLFKENNIDVDFSVRGTIDENTNKQPIIILRLFIAFGFKKVYQIIKILGIKWALLWIYWKILYLSNKTNREFLWWYRENIDQKNQNF